jgi:hypothetical protein
MLNAAHDLVVGVLAVEHEPQDGSWKALCAAVGVLIVWPGTFEAAFAANGGSDA